MTADRTPPTLYDAPGLVLRPRKDGWAATWQARTDLVTAGFEPKSHRICIIGQYPTDIDRALISDNCRRLQSEMLVWGRSVTVPTFTADGTLRALVSCYQIDPDSGYQKVRYYTRLNYDTLLLSLVRSHGPDLIADINARILRRWHEEWSKRGIPIAHSLMGMLRQVIGFGAIFLEDKDCMRVRGLLSGLKFKMGGARSDLITAEQAIAVRAVAHDKELHSIALAQAFQFECTLRQKDVIGEWVPINEPGPLSDVIDYARGMKWLRGIRWSEIDKDLILTHKTSKKDKDIEVNLRLAPMILEELERLGELPTSGPLIVDHKTGLPYRAYQFRRKWRTIADACGIPNTVKNMDSRAGAITEATDSGASLEDVRHAATHSNVATTQRYSRGQAKKTASVMTLRVKNRNKSGTGT